MSRFQILCFDGGGVRGAFSAALLQRLVASCPGLLNSTSLYSGTSTGGLLALGLAHGLEPQALVSLYQSHARDIFHHSLLDDIRDVGAIIGAHYRNKNLRSVLRGTFGEELTLGQLQRHVLIPSFDLDNLGRHTRRGEKRFWKAKFFHNFAEEASDDRKEHVVEVALRTAAAPTYFPSVDGFIDGGVVANNPSMAALSQALHPVAGAHSISEIRLLSISTGRSETFVEGKNLDWGLAQWARPIIQIMLEGNMGVADFQCQQILGSNYCRLDPWLPQPIEMDDANSVDELVSLAETVSLDSTLEWIHREWDFGAVPNLPVTEPKRRAG